MPVRRSNVGPRRTVQPRQMIWARQSAGGLGNADTAVNLMAGIAGDMGMTTMPPGTTVIRLLIDIDWFRASTAGARDMVWGIKAVPFNVVLPAVANFGPNLAQHSDWMWWYSKPHQELATARAASEHFDIRSARKMPEVESTLALYYQGNGALATDAWRISVSALLKLP